MGKARSSSHDLVSGASHCSTSSARVSSVGGKVSPRLFAVLRFRISSNFVGCSTGRSAGLAPLRILATNVAARRKRSTKLGPCHEPTRLDEFAMTVERGETVLRGKLHHLPAMEDGQSIAREDETTDPVGSRIGEEGFKLLGPPHHDRGGKRDVHGPGGTLHLLEKPGRHRPACHDGHALYRWHGLAEQLDVLLADPRGTEGEARDVSARSRQALYEPGLHGIVDDDHDDGNRPCGLANRLILPQPRRDDHVHAKLYQLVGHSRHALRFSGGEATLDHDVLPFDVSEGAEAVEKCQPLWGWWARRVAANGQEAD